MMRFTINVCLMMALVAGGLVQGQSPKPPLESPSVAKRKTSRAKVPTERSRLTKRQIRQAVAFARSHHPELARLIGRLKSSEKQAAYDMAVAELSRTAQKLEPLSESNPTRYGMLLELWKLESQARLMVARSTMKPDAGLELRLRVTLHKRAELRRTMLLSDIKRSRARILRIESQLKSLNDLDAATDRELQRLKRTARITAARTRGRGVKRSPVNTTPVKKPTRTKDNSKP